MKVALALSGGGFRASLFHLGVIRALRRAKILEDVDAIFAVSGGSIVAGHLYCRWNEYLNASPTSDPASELLALVRFDVRGRIVRRLFTPHLFSRWRHGEPTRTRLLRRMLDRLLYHDCRLVSPVAGSDVPWVALLATNLNRGTVASFFPGGFSPDALTFGDEVACEVSLASAVAASAAFPAFFPPMQTDFRSLNAVDFQKFPSVEYLTDGGVFDNLGLRTLRAKSAQMAFDRIIVSDASGAFDWIPPDEASGVIQTLLRANDILMKRIGDLEYEASSAERERLGVDVIRISYELDPTEHELGLSLELQRRLKHMRTDLDAFETAECETLVAHGDSVAGKILGVPLAAREVAKDKRRAYEKILPRGSERRLGLFSFRDPVSWWQASTLAVVFLALLTYLYLALNDTERRLSAELGEAVRQGEKFASTGPLPKSDDFAGFDLITEKTTLQFDEWRPDPGLSKVIWNRDFQIRRRSEGKSLRLRFATTGTALKVTCDNCADQGLPWRVDVFRSADVPMGKEPTFRRVWYVTVDMEKVPVGRPVTLSLTAINWNGFIPDWASAQRPETAKLETVQWKGLENRPAGVVLTGLQGKAQEREATIVLLFPSEVTIAANQFATRFRLEGVPDTAGAEGDCTQCSLRVDPANRMVTMSVPARAHVGYAILWKMPGPELSR